MEATHLVSEGGRSPYLSALKDDEYFDPALGTVLVNELWLVNKVELLKDLLHFLLLEGVSKRYLSLMTAFIKLWCG